MHSLHPDVCVCRLSLGVSVPARHRHLTLAFLSQVFPLVANEEYADSLLLCPSLVGFIVGKSL